ncbi:hypothetical protein SALWKB29_2167 [Snodgrassella communis]|uniref:Uncharacterized protein n=1 Tax=Snodgrassella communis TaxID=2946699 RepID=A0A836Z296_9NEIS|nr:hypothetical protein SALWKB29_2167 [Snodgrassella communis]
MAIVCYAGIGCLWQCYGQHKDVADYPEQPVFYAVPGSYGVFCLHVMTLVFG